jgi:predicted peroxiredoxin
MSRLLLTCLHGEDDPERATLPFVAANAAAAGQEATVVCTADAVWLGTNGSAIAATDLPPLTGLITEFLGNGGRIWLCSACTTPRENDERVLLPGVTIVGADRVVAELVAGTPTLAFA